MKEKFSTIPLWKRSIDVHFGLHYVLSFSDSVTSFAYGVEFVDPRLPVSVGLASAMPA